MIAKQIKMSVGLLLGLSLTWTAIPAETLTIEPLIHYPDPEYNPDPDPNAPWFTVAAGTCSVFHGYRTSLNGTLTYDYEAAVPGVYKIGFEWFHLDGGAESDIEFQIDGFAKVKVNSQDTPQGTTKGRAWHYSEHSLTAGTHEMKLIGTRGDNGSDAYLYFFRIELVKTLDPVEEGTRIERAEAARRAQNRKADTVADRALTKLISEGPGKEAKKSAGVEAGTVEGFPYLRNDKVAYLWSRPEKGGGLLRIRDLESGHELLEGEESEATWWQVEAKGKKGQSSIHRNEGVPCEIDFEAVGGEATLSLRWPGKISVQTETRLAAGESLARSRIKIEVRDQGLGLKTVNFPLVEGILALSGGADNDQVLTTHRVGNLEASPLVSGDPLGFMYPGGAMQFTTLMGDGRGLYFAEEDARANRKRFDWTPDAERGTLTLTISHPVLNWGAKELVAGYESPGDLVTGPFQGDWFDAARIYRKWALTAPWCRKGTIHQRQDYPRWLAELGYWASHPLKQEGDIDEAFETQAFFDLPISICKDYRNGMGAYFHDNNPEYLPPRLGSKVYAQLVKDLQAKGVRMVPYVIGYLWNTATESYRMEDAERRGGILIEQGIVPVTWAGSHDLSAGMCPATTIWRKKLLDLSKELVGKYGVDGIYFDYFTNHTEDCFNTDHGHPIAGGDFWSSGVHGLYEQVRRECKKLNPELMLCGEETAEWCIDVLDTTHSGGVNSNAPVYFAVYHGYTQVFGGIENCTTPQTLGRWWLMGAQSGENNVMPGLATGAVGEMGVYYRNLLRCNVAFAHPYLAYGEMLRPPQIEGDLPVLPGSACGQYQAAFPVKAIEGSAWQAFDGSVGLFFLNYDSREHEFTWTTDLNEFAGLDKSRKLKVTGWSGDKGEEAIGVWAGGVVKKTMTIEPWGLIALKLEVTQ
jgi:hypothetical protein